MWIPLHGVRVLQPPQAAAGPALWFATGSGALLGDRRRSMRRAPRLTPAGIHWVWTWEPRAPSAPVPEEWVIPPCNGPLAPPQEELLLEVEDMEVVVPGAHPTPGQVVPTAPQNVAAAIPPVLPAAPQRAPVASAHVPQGAQRPDGGVPEWCIDTPPQQFFCELCFELFTGDHSPVMLGCGNGHTCCGQCEGRLRLEAVNLCPVQ